MLMPNGIPQSFNSLEVLFSLLRHFFGKDGFYKDKPSAFQVNAQKMF